MLPGTWIGSRSQLVRSTWSAGSMGAVREGAAGAGEGRGGAARGLVEVEVRPGLEDCAEAAPGLGARGLDGEVTCAELGVEAEPGRLPLQNAGAEGGALEHVEHPEQAGSGGRGRVARGEVRRRDPEI